MNFYVDDFKNWLSSFQKQLQSLGIKYESRETNFFLYIFKRNKIFNLKKNEIYVHFRQLLLNLLAHYPFPRRLYVDNEPIMIPLQTN